MTNTGGTESPEWRETALRWLKSFFLIAFTLLIGIASVVTLASTLTQTRISSVTIDGVPLSIWKLEAIREQWASFRTQLANQTAELAKAENRRLDLNDQQSMASAKLISANQNFRQLVQTFAARIQKLDPALASYLNSDADISDKIVKINASDASLRAQADLNLAPLFDSIQQTYATYQQQTGELNTIAVETNGLIHKIQTLQTGITTSQKSINLVFTAVKSDLDEQTRARIENALYELNPSSGLLSEIIYKLVILQPDVLTLSLVLLMGILGSSLQILNSVFTAHRVDSFGNYILRISVGALTALVIFIVSKAGVPIIADTSKLGGDAPINPYFISFLAVISGLLSEQAIVTVQNQGARLFSTGVKEPDRWAQTDLTSRLGAENIAMSAIARYLNCSEGAAQSILKGETKADAEQQRTIAIFLRSNVRDLFTDIPPPNPNGAGATE